jgi:hypothetical protein
MEGAFRAGKLCYSFSYLKPVPFCIQAIKDERCKKT